MRPYLAIVVDSFREALHSRVLWLLALVITLTLAALAPVGYEERATVQLTDGAVRDWMQFLKYLREETQRQPDGVAAHVVGLLSEPTRKKIQEFQLPEDGDVRGAMKAVRSIGDVQKDFNAQFARRDFYDEKAWSGKPMSSEEGRVLLQRGVSQLDDQENARFNRLLFEAAFPEHVEASAPVSLQIRYAKWDALSPLPFRRDQFNKGVELVVSVIMKYFVGVVGVVIAVLVTASVIPQMFDPGSLNLLLSKPVSRSLLFLSKFFGGCAFILCNATYLIIGLWLILGVRFGIWDAKLLLTIPIYLFMFAIYYSVSALAGIVWRNAIVSIALSVLFWMVCFGVGLSKWLIESKYIEKQRLVRVIPAGDALFAVNEMGMTHQWDAQESTWRKVFQSDVQRQLEVAMYFMDNPPQELRPVGPVYEDERERLISLQRSLRTGQMVTYVGRKGEDWKAKPGATASLGSLALLKTPPGKIVDVSTLGIFRLSGEGSTKPEPLKVFGFSVPLPAADPYQSIGPDPPVLIARPSSVAMNPDTGELAIYSRATLTLLKFDEDGKYVRKSEKKLPLDVSQAAVAAWAGDTVVLGRDDGVIVMYDATSLEEKGHWKTDDEQPPRFIEAAPGGRHFAVTLHGGKLWLLDVEKELAATPSFARSGSVSAASFDRSGDLYVVDEYVRVSKYSLADERLIDRWSPTSGVVDLVYRYLLLPMYTICPKPGALDDTVSYLLAGTKTVDGGQRERQDLTTAREQLSPWAPVWSSGAFVLVMLGLSCLYLERQEF